MALLVDDLLTTVYSNVQRFTDDAENSIAAIDAKKGTIGYTLLDLDPKDFDAKFTYVPPDTTAMPTYVDPGIAMPTSPTLVGLHGIDSPSLPTAPSISTAGLFQEVMPSSVMPDWNEANPQLHVDQIYNELANLAAPILSDVNIPSITPLTLKTPPSLQLPDYEPLAPPEGIDPTLDYASFMDAKYHAMLPEMRAFVEDTVANWITRFAPGYEELRAKLHGKLMDSMNKSILPDDFEESLYTRARSRAEAEFTVAEESILDNAAHRGFIIPPGAVTSAMNKARLVGAQSLATQSTEVYLERRKAEIQHLQFGMQISEQQMANVRSLAVQYAGVGVNLIHEAFTVADQITAKLIVRFEHERSRHEFVLHVMQALNSQYEVKLKAALSGLEAYKLELQALEIRSNVEMKQVQAAKLQVEMQQLQVQRYSAMVDAIAKRAIVDELKIKEYQIRAEVFKVTINARLAAFEAYKAAIDGDKAKLQGELAKLEVYNSQLKAATLSVEVQSKILDADVKTNVAKLGQYTSQLDAYKIASQIALQKFTAGAEVKKLGLDVYKTNVLANMEIYKGELAKDTAWVTARVEAFKGNVQSLSNFYRLQQGYTELDLKKTDAIASGYSNMASASLQSLNATISKTLAQ